ncbi:unnamed protein product [Acanthoscelides obtectus]|uniref:Uncharacterized protein n=1 Tax=Acanthoscelides obtectus TaxID=200917 RepID=A0A9P0P1K3_ACAOB|nr:unnamed protein product [Acanthoscelides obtectus]CAK1633168.1 hypothetical protein AOBTE_LOCUS7976 [Acanthoscelides obtectus]
MVLWLKHNTEPWSEVMERFKKAHAIRRDCDRKTVKQFLQDWPIFQYLRGEVLVPGDINTIVA